MITPNSPLTIKCVQKILIWSNQFWLLLGNINPATRNADMGKHVATMVGWEQNESARSGLGEAQRNGFNCHFLITLRRILAGLLWHILPAQGIGLEEWAKQDFLPHKACSGLRSDWYWGIFEIRFYVGVELEDQKEKGLSWPSTLGLLRIKVWLVLRVINRQEVKYKLCIL
jgi:hypothetical protein